MKFKVIVISVATVFFLVGVADAGIGIGLDFKGGLNLAKMRGEDFDDMEDAGVDILMRPGAIVGAGVGIRIIKMFAIQPEVLFSMKGVKMKEEAGGQSLTGTVKLSYLEIPILFKLNIPAGPVVPNVYVGPDLSINLSSKISWETDPAWLLDTLGIDEEEDMKDDTEGIDFGLALGGGIDFTVGPGRIIFDIRYTLGFLTIDNEEDEDFRAEMKNGVLSFILGFGIDFGG